MKIFNWNEIDRHMAEVRQELISCNNIVSKNMAGCELLTNTANKIHLTITTVEEVALAVKGYLWHLNRRARKERRRLRWRYVWTWIKFRLLKG